MILVRANGCAVESDRVDESSRVKPIRGRPTETGLERQIRTDRRGPLEDERGGVLTRRSEFDAAGDETVLPEQAPLVVVDEKRSFLVVDERVTVERDLDRVPALVVSGIAVPARGLNELEDVGGVPR